MRSTALSDRFPLARKRNEVLKKHRAEMGQLTPRCDGKSRTGSAFRWICSLDCNWAASLSSSFLKSEEGLEDEVESWEGRYDIPPLRRNAC